VLAHAVLVDHHEGAVEYVDLPVVDEHHGDAVLHRQGLERRQQRPGHAQSPSPADGNGDRLCSTSTRIWRMASSLSFCKRSGWAMACSMEWAFMASRLARQTN